MVGILLLTHAPLGQAFKTVMSHIFLGQPLQFEVIDVEMDDNTDIVLGKAKKLVKRLDKGQGVLVMTDVTGSTPSNCAEALKEMGNVAVVAGVSVPMLLRTITYREQPLDIVSNAAIMGAKDGAVHVEQRAKISSEE